MKRAIFYGICVQALISTAAFAQEAAKKEPAAEQEAPTKAPAAEEAGGIEDIVVTARRVEERLQSVPVAITALSSDELNRRSVTDVRDIQTAAPSFRVSPSAQGGDALPVFTVRGLSSGGGGSDPSVVPYFADVPLQSSRAAAAGIYDLASVQILKGPQGTLFGKNSTGGAILFAPKRPDNTLGGYIQLGVGTFSYRELTFAANFPSDRFKVRIAGQILRRDGYQKNDAGPDQNSIHRDSFRASFLWSPTDNLQNYTILDYQQFDEQLIAPIIERVGVCPTQPLACFYTGANDLSAILAAQNARGVRRVSFSTPNYQEGWLGGVTNTTTLTLGNITLKNIVAYRKEHIDFAQETDATSVPLLDIYYRDRNEQLTEEFQVQYASDDRRLTAIAGAFYSDGSMYRFLGSTLFGGLPGPLRAAIGLQPNPRDLVTTNFSTSKALFAQATFSPIENVRITGGYRHTWDKRSQTYQTFFNGVCGVAPAAGVNLATCTRDLNTKFNAPNYTIGVDWQINPRTLFYVAHRRGYKSGDFNPTANDPALVAYAPETLKDFEVGLKTDFTLGSMPVRANISGFYGKYDDIIVTRVVVDNGISQQLLQNAARATIKGVEVELAIKPFTGLNLSGFFSYTKGVFDEFDDRGVNRAGQEFVGQPKTTFGLSGVYTLPLEKSLGEVSLSADYYWRSSYRTNFASTDPYETIASYGLLNLRADWKDIGGTGFDAAVFVKNVTDKVYRVGINSQVNTLLFGYSFYGEPRTFGAQIRYNFGAR